jgi:magnesium chelatase subunit D
MAERFPDALMAPMTQAMDTQSLPPLRMSDGSESAPRTQFGVVALDESMDDEPPIGKSLQERLGLWFDLQALAPSDVPELDFSQISQGNEKDQALDIRIPAEKLQQARLLLPQIQWSDDQALAVCATALGLGIDSLRTPTLALRVACCHAALNMRSDVSDEDLEFAARRVLAPRATRWPAPAEQQPAPEPETSPESPPETASDQETTPDPSPEAAQEPPDEQAQQDPPPADQTSQDEPPSDSPSAEDLQEMMIAAALASLPPNILDSLLTKTGSSQGNSSGRSGQFRSGMQRGRPLPPRPGRPAGHAPACAGHLAICRAQTTIEKRYRPRPRGHPV